MRAESRATTYFIIYRRPIPTTKPLQSLLCPWHLLLLLGIYLFLWFCLYGDTAVMYICIYIHTYVPTYVSIIRHRFLGPPRFDGVKRLLITEKRHIKHYKWPLKIHTFHFIYSKNEKTYSFFIVFVTPRRGSWIMIRVHYLHNVLTNMRALIIDILG